MVELWEQIVDNDAENNILMREESQPRNSDRIDIPEVKEMEQAIDDLLIDENDDFDIENYLLGSGDNFQDADFMIRNKGALDRLKSIRISKRMSTYLS